MGRPSPGRLLFGASLSSPRADDRRAPVRTSETSELRWLFGRLRRGGGRRGWATGGSKTRTRHLRFVASAIPACRARRTFRRHSPGRSENSPAVAPKFPTKPLVPHPVGLLE